MMSDEQLDSLLADIHRESEKTESALKTLREQLAAERPLGFTICELDLARQLLTAGQYDHALSLVSPNVVLEQRTAAHTVIRMEDLAVEGLNGPTREHVQQIIDLARSLPPLSRVLVHCHAGQSRSPAAAIIMLVALGIKPQEAFDQVKFVRPILLPNMLMIHYADQLLDLHGELEHVVNAHTGRMIVPREPVKINAAEVDQMKAFMELDFGMPATDELRDTDVVDRKEALYKAAKAFVEQHDTGDKYRFDPDEAFDFIVEIIGIAGEGDRRVEMR